MRFPFGLGGICWAPLRFAAPDSGGWPVEPLRCRSCHSRDCALAVPSGVRDRRMLAAGCAPYECRVCGRRFRHYTPEAAARLLAQMEADRERAEAALR
jgi:hypothetical protein